MIPGRSEIPCWRIVVLTALALTLCVVPATAFGDRTLSEQAFEQLKIDVQTKLDAQHDAAHSTDEIFPGATAAFVLRDGRAASFSTGYSDIEARVVMTPEARMPAGSIGKTFTAAVALSMVLEGTLDLDGKILQWLGAESWFDHLPNGNEITLRNLLNHSSGLIDHVFSGDSGFGEYAKEYLARSDGAVTADPRDLVQFVLDRDPLFLVGEGFNYTDTGYILVGLIVEQGGGATYYDELEKRFLKPLALTRTTAQNRRAVSGLVQGYAPISHQLFGVPLKVVSDGAFLFDPSIEWTGGGLVSSSQDLAKWAKALYEGKAMNKPYLDTLLGSVAQTERGTDSAGRQLGYGLGASISKTDLGTTYGHGGFFPGYNSQMLYFPDHQLAIAMQINTDRSRVEDHILAIAKIVIDALAEN